MSEHTTTFAAVAAALMLVLAGCAGGVPSTGGNGAGTTDGGDEGTVNFYVSDQQNAIDDFEHLNVTIERVVLVRADGNETETEADAENDSDAEADDENETETDGADEENRVVYDVENVTVDLTELQGANATRLGSIPAPNGTYTKVFVHVSDVNGTLEDGSSAAVKLPSNKLRLNKEFTVGNGEEVDFVFDVTVFERGNNGYILKPVAGESGTGDEVEIRDVDRDEETDDESDAGNGANENAGGANGANDAEDADDDDGDDEAGESENASDAGASGQSSMSFYLSDEQNAMGDFAHLNVTVTKVGLHRADGGWVERDVDDRTVDLTTLPGASATRLGTFGVENGTYDKVFVYVDSINATLENGESTRVKLPSSKLQLNTEFTVGNGEEVDFVYDMSVFEAGNSGKYILKPVVSESGTGDQVPIEDVDENETDDDEADLNASFVGNVSAGTNATVEVTRNGSAVENATVTVAQEADDETTATTYSTGDNGTVTFLVAENATELTVEATDGDAEAELEREFEGDDDSDETEEADLNASFVGNVSTDANATVEVTRNGSAVENATVTVTQEVDGELSTQTYTTDANGTVTFDVDANATELTVTATADGDEADLEREFESGGDDASASDDGSNGNGNGNNGNGNGNAALRFAG